MTRKLFLLYEHNGMTQAPFRGVQGLVRFYVGQRTDALNDLAHVWISSRVTFLPRVTEPVMRAKRYPTSSTPGQPCILESDGLFEERSETDQAADGCAAPCLAPPSRGVQLPARAS